MSIENQSVGRRGKGDLSYKYQRLRERLRTAVKTGELAGKLPGERELARRFAANAKTINKALNDLAMDGLVMRHVGRGTFVAGAGPIHEPPAIRSQRYVWLTPEGGDGVANDRLLAELQTAMTGDGHHIEGRAVALNEDGELPENALSLREMRQLNGVVIAFAKPSRNLLASLRRRRLSVILLGIDSDYIRLPAVLCDLAYGAFAACRQCLMMGHRNVQWAVDDAIWSSAKVAYDGYCAAMRYHGLEPKPALRVDACFNWSALLTGPDRPSALVCLAGGLAIQAWQEARTNGIQVPSQLSIAAHCRPGEMCIESQAITSYETNPSSMLTWVTEMINQTTGSHGPEKIIVPGRLIDRGSIIRPSDNGQLPGDPSGEARL